MLQCFDRVVQNLCFLGFRISGILWRVGICLTTPQRDIQGVSNMVSTTQTIPHANPAENWFEETYLWKIKVWLQFTGWLLYLSNFIAALLVFGLAAIGSWIGAAPIFLVWLPFGIACILVANLCFDIATVRFNLRPTEPIPSDRTDLDPFDLMRERVSCRSFQSRDLTPKHQAELLETVRLQSAPKKQLGFNTIRFEYLAAPLTVWPVVGGHEFLVAIAPIQYHRMSVIDIGRSLQKIVIHATRMGLSTCWIGPGADQRSIIKHLGERFDPAHDHVICVCAVGYASKFKPVALRGIKKVQRKRLPLEKLFSSDGMAHSRLNTSTAPFENYGRCYEVCQWSPSSYNGQTTRCVAVMNEGKLARFDFYAATASRYYAAVALGIWCANWEMGCEALDKRGHFAVAPQNTGADERTTKQPGCDVSWIVD
jgi:nitroreductase